MKTQDDQWFVPGDKVMRVATALTLKLPTVGFSDPRADFGRVLCVESCMEWRGFNIVNFVGITVDNPLGFYAKCFRKVEEIKLCVEAVEKTRKENAVPAHLQPV